MSNNKQDSLAPALFPSVGPHAAICTHSRLRQLLRDDNVLFSGYKMPHPLEQDCHVKVQCKKESNPTDALLGAVNDLHTEFSELTQRFSKAVEKFQQDNAGLM